MAQQMTEEEKEKAAAKAAEEAKLWAAALRMDGVYDKEFILSELRARTFEGGPVVARVVEDPEELKDAILSGAREIDPQLGPATMDVLKQASLCVWDYYYIAFFESACGQLDDEPEWTRQSLFPAFKAGLGHVVNMGSLVVGLVLPRMCLDVQGRLHCETGPAIAYKKSKSYWWHGVQIDDAWIEKKDKLTAKQAINEKNAEKKRILYEIIGAEKIAKEVGAKCVQKDDFGQLYTAQLNDDRGRLATWVKVVCPSTAREYWNRVSPECKTAREALAARWRMKPEEYDLLAES